MSNDDDLPPPYSFSSSPGPSVPVQSVPHILSSHLSGLPARISLARTAHSSARDEQDAEILALLVPHIEDLLQTFSLMDPTPSRLEMTMVPQDAVGADWEFSDGNRLRKLIRVGEPTKGPDVKEKEEEKKTSYDDWGNAESSSSDNSLWWEDEALASRLCKHLRYEPPQPKPEPQPVEPPQQRPTKKGWGGFFRKAEPVPVRFQSAPRVQDDGVDFTVQPKTVSFRRENEMGIWESKSGYGLVVRIRVRQ